MKTVRILLLIFCVCLSARELTLLRADGDSIVNSLGERVNFRGLHVTNESWGYWEYPISDSLDLLGNKDPLMPQKTFPSYALEEADFQNIQKINPFLVRYELCYNVFASDNPLRASNMEILKKHVNRFNQLGIYVVLDLHFGPGLHLSAAGYEDKNPGAIRMPTIFEDSETFEKHCQWWEYVANEFRDNAGIAGYQILVEPRVPAEKDGGWNIYKERMIALCKRIRAIDPNHLLITHHVHSREVNPGEQYWSPNTKTMVTDTGEQGVIWASDPRCYTDPIECFPLIDLPNIIYSFSMYAPYDFTTVGHDGTTFTDEKIRESVNSAVKVRADFGIKHNVPILVDEYGVSHFQTEADMLRWLKIVHEVYASYDLPSWFFQYKGGINPFNNVKKSMGLYMYLGSSADFIEVADTNYSYKSGAEDSAKATGFDSLFKKYFWDFGTFESLSKVGYDEFYSYMKEYLAGTESSNINTHNSTASSTLMTMGKNKITFSNPLSKQHSVSLFDMKGRRVWSHILPEGAKSLNVPLCSQGVYVMKIDGTEITFAQKFIICF